MAHAHDLNQEEANLAHRHHSERTPIIPGEQSRNARATYPVTLCGLPDVWLLPGWHMTCKANSD